ncbi:MAG: magnesium transporter CorA family protein [Pseudomonadota bacterium]
MRIFHIQSTSITESQDLAALTAAGLPAQGFVWVACARREFEVTQGAVQTMLQALCGQQLVDLHISDLINNHLPSHYDYTSQYDVLVFRRLAAGSRPSDPANPGEPLTHESTHGGPPILRRIDTSPVGFAVFDRVLLTVHPTDCAVRDAYASKLMQASSAESRAAGARLPTSPADLMLRVINQMVDGFLELRRELTHQLDHWQTELLNPRTRFTNWAALLDARLTLHYLDEVCEDQRASLQDWIEAVKTWPEADTAAGQRERDLLQVRSRDVLEHIERVVHHVRRLEQSVETAVQMHFSVQGSRTNDIMRTLTALTAIFLPLNLITGFFGMNFDALPLIHQKTGVLWAMGSMVVVAVGLGAFFWRKRYLARSGR